MRTFLALSSLILCCAFPLSAGAACHPLPGADAVWAKSNLRWVFVGELHGSNETPEAFGDLVCDALLHGKQVTVAMELPSSEQSDLQNILTAKNLPVAEAQLLQQSFWRDGIDGRSSTAMLRLLLRLRQLHGAYPNLKVLAFDDPYSGNNQARDVALAGALLKSEKANPDNLILILTGNAHGMFAPVFGYDPAAMYIPAAQRLSLEVTDRGGVSWSEIGDACGPMKGGVGGKMLPRGIYLDPTLAPFGKVDGVLSLGVPLTPAEPAAPDAVPVPLCKSNYLREHAAPITP